MGALEFSMERFVDACVGEFGAGAADALRRGDAPASELRARVRGEYALSFVDGEFDFTVGEMASGACARREGPDALCAALAAVEMLGRCVVAVEARLARLVLGAVAAALASRRRLAGLAGLAALPDDVLVRIGDVAWCDAFAARLAFASRRRAIERDLTAALVAIVALELRDEADHEADPEAGHEAGGAGGAGGAVGAVEAAL